MTMKPTPPPASRQLEEALDGKVREASAGTGPSPPCAIEAATAAGSVSVQVEDADRLGILAGPVTARRAAGTGSVAAQAREAARRLNYLQEPLTVVESEGKRARAILRSETPRQAGGGREYNEAVLQGGDSITIRRYRAESGSRRKAIPSNLSRETLGRLADDLIDILQKD
jgi:hypothetical protein